MQKQIRFYGRLDSYPPYDTFDNLANRTGAYYYGSYSSDTGTYQNSRRQDWTYDADGQVTQSPTSSSGATTFRDWQYDAAGQMIKAVDTSTSSGTTTTKTYTSSYDGDGKLISELTSSQGLSYVVRSSVTGKVVTRVGATQKNIVSVDGLLTTVLTDGPPATIQWVHTDPHGLSEVTNTSGQQRAVYDPLENYIPNQPWPGPSGLSFPGGQSPSSGLGSNFGFTGTSSNVACTLEGLPYDCNKAFHMIATGSAEQCPNNYCGPERVINPWTRQVELRPLTRDPETGQLGYFPTKPKAPKGSLVRQDAWERQHITSDACGHMAALAQQQANKALSQAHDNASKALGAFDLGFSRIYAGKPMDGISNAYDLFMHGPEGRTIDPYYVGETGFKVQYMDTDPEELAKHSDADQTHHFTAMFSGGLNSIGINAIASTFHNVNDNAGDQRLTNAAYDLGSRLESNPNLLRRIGALIRSEICDPKTRGKHL